LTLALTATAAPPPVAPVPAATPASAPPSQPPAESQGHSKVLPVVLLAVGGAGLVVGASFGVLALGTKSSLDSSCANKQCPASSQGNINSLGTQAWVSNIGFGVGIIAGVLGTYFLLSSGGSEQPKSASTPLEVRPWVGLGSAGLGGTFQ
jgi:hypothetical protein